MSVQSTVIQAPSTNNNNNNEQHDMGGLQTDEIISEDEARMRREQLNRRPSYRMILKDLETIEDKQLKKEPDGEESTISHENAGHERLVEERMQQTSAVVSYPSVQAPHLQLPNGELGSLAPLRIQTSAVTVTTLGQYSPNVMDANGHVTCLGGPVQNAATGLIMPVNNDILGLKPMADVSGMATTSGGSFVVANHALLGGYNSSPSPLGMASGDRQHDGGDDSNRKRQVRLLKNREAAKECRRKKKEYVKCLESRVAVLENQNKALIEELKTLKELYCRKEQGEVAE